MCIRDSPTSISSPQLDSISLTKNQRSGGEKGEFYEIESAVVLDIILDKNHDYFKHKGFTVSDAVWPVDVNGKKADPADPDFTWMGRALVRLIYSQRNLEKEDLVWALPLDSNLSEYPLLNETVGVICLLGQYYYTRKINSSNVPNTNANFKIEPATGGFKNTTESGNVSFTDSKTLGNRELKLTPNEKKTEFQGPTSKLKYNGGNGYEGALGRYFTFNPRIRSLKRREGDFILESRFGQSMRFGAYDDNRNNDKGHNSEMGGYRDYKGDGTKYKVKNVEYEQGGGNPMILIRNRQRPLAKSGEVLKVYDNLPSVVGTSEEKNVGGYMLEDINNDGSSIHMTSGVTVSNFKTNCYKKMWGDGSEEQPGFNGITNFKYPTCLLYTSPSPRD